MECHAFAAAPDPVDPFPPSEADQIPRSISVRAIDLDPYETSTAHWHDAVGQLAWVRKGSLRISTPGKLWFVLPSQALWIPPTIPHAVEAGSSKVEMRNVYARVGEFDGLPEKLCIIPVDDLLFALIDHAVTIPRLYRHHSPQERLLLTLIDQISVDPEFSKLSPSPDSVLHSDELMVLPMPDDQRLIRVCRALLDDPADCRKLAEWSGLAGASERTLSRLFLQETGMTFAHWRMHMRALQACCRLKAGDEISKISFDLGYTNHSAFITMFRKKVGLTPARFRSMMKARLLFKSS